MTNMKSANIALIGDFSEDVVAHQAIPLALKMSAKLSQIELSYKWIQTDQITAESSSELNHYSGFWCVPASPYLSMEGALRAIQFARENNRPFLGTCGGYQHAILEYFKNNLGYTDAGNAEVDPETSFPLISSLSCALIEQFGVINLVEGSKAASLHHHAIQNEKYHCSYGFNRDYIQHLAGSEMLISGYDNDGDPRVVELIGHPFFIGTAYQPERSALEEMTHPLINAFLDAAAV